MRGAMKANWKAARDTTQIGDSVDLLYIVVDTPPPPIYGHSGVPQSFGSPLNVLRHSRMFRETCYGKGVVTIISDEVRQLRSLLLLH